MLIRILLKIFVVTTLYSKSVFSAESGGMPQLDPEYWLSQIFWLKVTFGFLFIILSKFVLPNISSNLENRKTQILNNIDIAEKQRDESENNIAEYEKIILKTKGDAKNLINEAKVKVIEEINKKKNLLDSEINKEISDTENEIIKLKKNSPEKISQIAVDTSLDLIKQLIGAEMNKSNISAIVQDISKKERDKQKKEGKVKRIKKVFGGGDLKRFKKLRFLNGSYHPGQKNLPLVKKPKSRVPAVFSSKSMIFVHGLA